MLEFLHAPKPVASCASGSDFYDHYSRLRWNVQCQRCASGHLPDVDQGFKEFLGQGTAFESDAALGRCLMCSASITLLMPFWPGNLDVAAMYVLKHLFNSLKLDPAKSILSSILA